MLLYSTWHKNITNRELIEKKETKGSIYEVNGLYHINAKMDALAQKVESLVINPTANIASIRLRCKIYGTLDHITVDCSLLVELSKDQVNYAQGNPYTDT